MKFDYVIVGGGSAGCVLAARLSEDPGVSVCLLEAGGGGNGILVRLPLGIVPMLPGRPKINNWALETIPQPGLNGRRGYQPRGKALGGSSAINAMLYVRGQRQDYDDWAELGCEGWDWENVLPYFRRAENNVRGEDTVHGAEGPLQVSDQQAPRELSEAFLKAAEDLQFRRRQDFNAGDNEGVGYYQVTQFHDPARRGERCSAAAGYLFPAMARPNLTVITRALAQEITFEGKRASGVMYRGRQGVARVEARREVLLCSGALHSPALLLRSGVGEGEALAKLGISVRHDLPGVGQNLQDHIDFVLGFKSLERDMIGIGPRAGLSLLGHLWRWRQTGVSMAASPIAEAGGFLKTDPGLDRPDVQLHFAIGLVDDHARRLHSGYGFSCHVCLLRPKSRGEVFLQSKDPQAPPGIDPKFLSEHSDLDVMIKGARLTREILQGEALRPYRDREMFGTGKLISDADWEGAIRARADTVYHPVGSCKMGSDDMAVVDSALRVRGAEGLRVVDASIMPLLVSGNTNAPTIMIAEKAADLIRAC